MTSLPHPRPVWVAQTGPGGLPVAPTVGLLLEWRRRVDERGVPQWWGLVAEARGGGDRPWAVEVHWVWQVKLQPMDVSRPRGSGGDSR